MIIDLSSVDVFEENKIDSDKRISFILNQHVFCIPSH